MKNDLKIQSLIRSVPDFPKKGVIFRDITPLLADAEAFSKIVEEFVATFKDRGVTKIVGIESRGFILASAFAYAMGVGLVLVRKAGKLPCATECTAFSLEYGADRIEIHKDSLNKDDKVIIVDDVLATGGTMRASVYLVKRLGAQIETCAFLIELRDLNGRENIDAPVDSLFTF